MTAQIFVQKAKPSRSTVVSFWGDCALLECSPTLRVQWRVGCYILFKHWTWNRCIRDFAELRTARLVKNWILDHKFIPNLSQMKTPLNNVLSIILHYSSVDHVGSISQCPSFIGQHQNHLPGFLKCNIKAAHGVPISLLSKWPQLFLFLKHSQIIYIYILMLELLI